MSEKPPRAYAAEIMEMKSREERRAALEAVPAHLRMTVRTHVEIGFCMLNNLSRVAKSRGISHE